ncbi:helix-turn-helix domain-containing protein [Streptomyces sp. SID4928]|uniref:helix-turn-helix transcriptional regulator n=1 Tax=unclassified Streptomyces TaxID=2593676 RepID=UPI0001C1A089|nr:helix-turn-helix domain-containing protein [Streptomyces sp. ACT-1]EGE43205.1 regulatory protein MerR [Streptomyces sp. ACT-1]MYR51243.1 helix-turn-helix domain-containing protein [Streptomyces sp. SID4928]
MTAQKLTKAQAAELLDISVRTLERWGRAGFGPRPQRHGPRLVRYDEAEVLRYQRNGEQALEESA